MKKEGPYAVNVYLLQACRMPEFDGKADEAVCALAKREAVSMIVLT